MAVYGNIVVNQKMWTLIKANYPSLHCFHSLQSVGENFNKSPSRCLNGNIGMQANPSVKQAKFFNSENNIKGKTFKKTKINFFKNIPNSVYNPSFVNVRSLAFLFKLPHCRYSTAINNSSADSKDFSNQEQLNQSEKCYSSQVDGACIKSVASAKTFESVIPKYLHFHPACRPDTQKEIISSFQVLNDYLSEDEEDILMKDVEPHLKRLPYEFDHWDDAIHGFRETERSRWGKAASPIISKMRRLAFPEGERQIAQVHVLDLAKTGVIKPHVDSIRFCGNIICGLCLLSDAVMRLVHVDNKDQVIDILLPKRCLYLMKDESRYKYTHEVLGEKESYFNATSVPRERRISIICRNNPRKEDIM